MTLLGYAKVIPYAKFEHLEIICFRVRPMLRTNKQTAPERATHADRQSRRGNKT